MIIVCANCGTECESKRNKKYCSMKCYTQSVEFKEMKRVNMEKCNALPRVKGSDNWKECNCLECGNLFTQKPVAKTRKPKQFCSKICWRKYQAARFDRWIANPEKLKLPQCYDEFLSQDVLPCLVEGCDWKGHFLTRHLDQAHGLKAKEAKILGGFNLRTPLYSTTLIGAFVGNPAGKGIPLTGEIQPELPRYVSNESREHHAKAQLSVWLRR